MVQPDSAPVGESRVDDLARAVASSRTRRSALKQFGLLLAGGLAGGVASGLIEPRSASAAAVKCPSGTTKCTVCISTSSDPNNCGACGHVCPTPAHAVATCAGGQCGFVCNSGFADCNGNPADGCETNLSTDVNHCGSCATVCSANNGAPSCVNGTCQITCNSGFGDCNGNPADGCETTLSSDPNNCGACGHVCSANNGTPMCTSGQCRFICNPGFADCNGNPADGCETNVFTDVNNCGACGRQCAPGQSCSGGVCV
jgi:hypothetical protein